MIKQLKGELADLIMDKNMKKLKDLKAILKKKKAIARELTKLRQAKLLKDLEEKK